MLQSLSEYSSQTTRCPRFLEVPWMCIMRPFTRPLTCCILSLPLAVLVFALVEKPPKKKIAQRDRYEHRFSFSMADELALEIVKQARQCCVAESLVFRCNDKNNMQFAVLSKRLVVGGTALCISTHKQSEMVVPWKERLRAVKVFVMSCNSIDYSLRQAEGRPAFIVLSGMTIASIPPNCIWTSEVEKDVVWALENAQVQ